MSGDHTGCSFLLTLIVLLVSVQFLSIPVSAQPQVEQISFDVVSSFFREGDGNDRIQDHVKYLGGLGSRVSGYPGFFEAADYIANYLEGIGVQPYGDEGFYENYYVTVPMDWGANITLADGMVFNTSMCWPNFVNTNSYTSPPEGDRVIYVGRGEIDDFDGKDVSGKFVIMDFNSKWFFRFAIMFGAKGVIYNMGTETLRGEAFSKIYYQPIKFPRYLLSQRDSSKMIDYLDENDGEARIWIRSKMTWERVIVPNIIGLIEGSDPDLRNEYIALCAYYDSFSIFPSTSPGATDSIGPSVLLELSRFLVENRPKRSVIILLTSGHFQNIWGAREYVDKHFSEVGVKIKIFIDLDLSYGTDQLAVMNKGFTYGYKLMESLNAKYAPLVFTIFNRYLPTLRAVFGQDYGRSFVDGILQIHPPFIQSSPPMRFAWVMFDSEPFTLAAFGGGFSINTVNDYRTYQMTPLDTYDRVIFSNVWSQAYFVAAVAYGLLNEPTLPLSASGASRFHTEWGYATLNITVTTYNLTTNFFNPVTKESDPEVWDDLIVHYVGGTTGFAGNVQMATPQEAQGSVATAQLAGILEVIAKPDKHGTVTIKGIKPYTGQDAPSFVNAFAVDSTEGSIYWATDLGSFGALRLGGNTALITSSYMTKLVPIFECGSIVLMNMLNPRDLSSSLNPVVYNFLSHGPMIRWGQWTGSPIFGDRMFFIEPGIPAEIVIYFAGAGAPSPGQLQVVGGAGATSYVWGALLNSTHGYERPSGYIISRKGETVVIKYPSFEYANQLFLLNDARVSTAERFSVSNPMIVLYHGLAEGYMESSSNALDDLQYSSVYGDSFAAWGYEQRAYVETIGLIQNAIFTTSFFFLLVLPFAYVFERLTFSYFGLKRVLAVMLISILLVLFLYFFHPGFHLAHNLLMVLTGFGMIVVIIPIIGFLISEASSSAKAMSSKILGIHSLASTAGAVISAAFGTGIQWMKKRPFRSALTLASITIITFSLMTFTSLATIAVPRTLSTTDTPVAYSGLLIRQKPWANIPTELWLQLKAELGESAYVAPRVWFFPPAGPSTRGFIYWNVQNLTARIYSVLALGPEEQEISGIWDRIKVRGRWFYPDETFSIIISRELATNLTRELGRPIGPGAQIAFYGLNLTVVGLFDGASLYSGFGFSPESGLIDLDGEPITPRDPVMAPGGAQAVPPHLQGSYVVIVPFELLWKIFSVGAQPVSIAIKPLNDSDIEPLALKLAYRLNTLIIYGLIKGKSIEGWPIGDVVEVTARSWFSFLGAENLMVPMIIAAVSILNMTIGVIYERIRSISVYIVVGSTPTQIAGMFLAESLVYGVLSSVLGYVLGISATSVLIRLGAYPPDFFPNFASSFILVIVGLAIAIPVLAAVYPALKAWRLVTPSLERKWKIPEPVGDHWTVPLPFVVTADEELLGIFGFLKEYFDTYSGYEKTGLFSTERLSYDEYIEGLRTIKRLSAVVRLAPYDLALMENVDLEAVAQEGRYNLTLHFLRTSGVLRNWKTSNKVFINALRKQFLIWRVLPPSQKDFYQKRAAESLRSTSRQQSGRT